MLEKLKEMHKRENVIILSAKDSIEDKVLGLELGADDLSLIHISPLSLVCSNNSSRSCRSCPLIRIPGRVPVPIFTWVISGLPYLEVFALSSRAIVRTPISPVFSANTVSSSADKDFVVI